MTEGHLNQEGTFKKIQNYIFNFNDLLGKGNFSKVYKAHNEVTSKVSILHRRSSGYQNNRVEQSQKQKTIIIAVFLNRNLKKIESSECRKMFRSVHKSPKLLHNHIAVQLR